MASTAAPHAVVAAPDASVRRDAHGRDARAFWHIPRQGWREIVVRTWNETNDDNLSLLAAGVAFYSFLAFVPLLASIVLVYGLVVTPADVAEHMQALMRILPTDAAHIVGDQLSSLTRTPVSRSTIGLIVAILLALYGAMRGATSMIGALNIAYGERETRSLVRTTGLSLAFTAGGVAAAIVAGIAISIMGVVGRFLTLPTLAASSVTALTWLGTAVVASGLIAAIYRYGPDRRDARWTWLTPGALFASLGTLFATLLFGIYVDNFAGYNATYGALGAVVSFLMWLYVSAFVVLLGAELNAEVEHQTAIDTTVGPERPLGERDAEMADTVANGTSSGDMAAPAPAIAVAAPDAPAASSRVAPVVAGFLAARGARWIGDVPVGTVSMSLLSTGLSMVARRGKRRSGLALLGVGVLLVIRAQRAATARDDRSAA